MNPALAPHSTIPGTVNLTLGGVARNIAEAATRVTSTAYPGTSSLLVAPIGEDSLGHVLAEQISRKGMRTDGLVPMHEHTAVCNMVLDGQGSLVGGVSDMDITEDFSPESVGLPPVFVLLVELVAHHVESDYPPTTKTLSGIRCLRW